MSVRSTRALAFASLAALTGALLLVAPRTPAQEAPRPLAWDYEAMPWEAEDTAAVLRAVAGADSLAKVDDLARSLGRELELAENARVQAAIDRHLARKLAAKGKEGWELAWVRDRNTFVGGFALPVPTVLLKRPAR